MNFKEVLLSLVVVCLTEFLFASLIKIKLIVFFFAKSDEEIEKEREGRGRFPKFRKYRKI